MGEFKHSGRQAIKQFEKDVLPNMVTEDQLEDLIVSEQYHVFPGTTVTVCCLILKNGAGIIGESACVSMSNFNERIGKEIARANAKNKMWELEGYVLRNKLTRL